jgi:hypothetical protein
VRRIVEVRNVPDKEGFAHRGELAVLVRDREWTAWGYGENRDTAVRDAEGRIALAAPQPTIN